MNTAAKDFLGFSFVPDSYYDIEQRYPAFGAIQSYIGGKSCVLIKDKKRRIEVGVLSSMEQKVCYMMCVHEEWHFKDHVKQKEETKKLELIADMASKISHEIKNPLVSVKTFTQLLEKRWQDQVDKLNTICSVPAPAGLRRGRGAFLYSR